MSSPLEFSQASHMVLRVFLRELEADGIVLQNARGDQGGKLELSGAFSSCQGTWRESNDVVTLSVERGTMGEGQVQELERLLATKGFVRQI